MRRDSQRRPGWHRLEWWICALCVCATLSCAGTFKSRFQKVRLGMSQDEVLHLLGKPDKEGEHVKPPENPSAPPVFGPQPSELFRALPAGSRFRNWEYRRGKETYGVTFAGDVMTVVNLSYHHRDMVY